VTFDDVNTGARIDSAPCEGNWSITSQNGSEFSGSMSVTGAGVRSDKICTSSSDFSGRMNGDGALTEVRPARFWFSGRCTNLSNDGTMSGAIDANGTIALRTTARGTCLDGGDQPREAMRTVTVTLTRR
jgi:hypothetical protein